MRILTTKKIPPCEACGKPGVVKYDSQGEGYFWLCDRKDGDHGDDVYCGVEVERLERPRHVHMPCYCGGYHCVGDCAPEDA